MKFNNKHKHWTNEYKTKLVVYLTALTMIVEITAGYLTNSMALLADGWHMASHVLALGLSWIAYYFVRKHLNNKKFKHGTDKILSLAGYSSALLLLIVAILMAIESIERLLNPISIQYKEALIIAGIGLIVNLISAKLLHTDPYHADHNIKSAYLHVLADTLTSITAIIALLAGILWQIESLDAISGIISSIVITKWAIDLIKESGKDLLDYSS